MGSSEPVAAVALADRWRPGPPPLLLAARCTACGEVSFPSRPWCPECWSETETETLPPVGTLYTFTTVHVGDGAPRVLGYADFGEVRVLGPLTGAVPWIGALVTVTETGPGQPGAGRTYAFCVSDP
jgi:uncharacterized OB-fold protein